MEELKVTDIQFPLSAMNLGMLAYSAMEGKTAFAAFQGSLFALNAGMALEGRKNDIKSAVSGVPQEASEKALGGVYDSALSDSVRDEVMELSGKKKGGRGNHTSGRRIC